jgi:hypothetical protein
MNADNADEPSAAGPQPNRLIYTLAVQIRNKAVISVHLCPSVAQNEFFRILLDPPARAIPALTQLRIQMSDGGELAGELGVAGSLQPAPRRKIAAAEQVGRGDHRRSHGAILVSTLRPGKIAV